MRSIVEQARPAILEWFTGKARQNAEHALDLLAQSETAGEWLPGASRKVEAALTKSNIAKRLAMQWGRQLEAIGSYRDPESERGWEIAFLLQYGGWQRATKIDFDAIERKSPSPELTKVIRAAHVFLSDFTPVVELIAVLDVTVRKPVFTSVGASPTITGLLESIGLLANIATIRMPPIEWFTVERTELDGRKYLAKVGRLVWPRGTIHGASRYAETDRHRQCQACGHAIKNAYNWVPLLIDNLEGVPHSLWVGRDCAQTLFGIQMKGNLELTD